MASLAREALAAEPGEDLSLPSLHLLLLLFHSLQLMQKKSVLVCVGRALGEVCGALPASPGPHCCLLLARLALLLDYLVRHLYEPPASLLPAIRRDLFSRDQPGQPDPAAPLVPAELTLEPGEASIYYLAAGPTGCLAPADLPKLDGLAVSFLLSTPDKMDYPGLHAGLLAGLEAALASRGGRSAHYCVLVVWRLLAALPPPAPLLARLAAAPASPGPALTLYTLLLAPRANHKNFGPWMRDCLVKQGLAQAEAEQLLRATATEVNSLALAG